MGESIVLPCNIGDEVYVLVNSADTPYIKEDVVIAFEIWNYKNKQTLYVRTTYGLFKYDEKCVKIKEKKEK